MGAAGALSVAATGLGAAGKISSGFTAASNAIQQGDQAAEMDQFRAGQLADASEYGKAQANQTDSIMRQNLVATLGNMMAVRASANTAGDSPTGQAILNATQGQADRSRAIRVGNLYAQSAESANEATIYTTNAQQTLNSAYANAGTDQLNGILGGVGSLFTGLSGLKFMQPNA